jgi:hypothetical protein
MTSSWKIGAISGLIAGIIGGLVFTIFVEIAISNGLFPPTTHPTVTYTYTINAIIGVFFGVIAGAIYSRVYSLIPGKGVSKGLLYGIILLIISWIQVSTFSMAYGHISFVVGEVFTAFFKWIAYGLVLGFLYESLCNRYCPVKEEPKIVTYNFMSGIIPGAIAGVADGIAAAFANAIASMTGLYGPEVMAGAPDIFSFDFWIFQSGGHIFVNLVWGAIFGMIFAKVYNIIPGRKISKGLCYSFMIFLFSTFLASVYWIAWGWTMVGLYSIFVGICSTWLAYGIVLGYLYRKPSE